MRKRKRDWPVTVYKYAVADAVIPQALWDTARAMHDLWCSLARLHAETRATVGDDTSAENRKRIWAEFEELADAMVKDHNIPWACKEEVRTRFDACCVRAARQGDGGWPRVRGMRSICIPHRYTGGGAELKALTGKAKRFRLDSLSTGLVPGVFGLDGDAIRFRAVIHRTLPEGAIVKNVRWLGRRGVVGWEWAITITVEAPPGPPRVLTGKSVGIDLGWRMQGDAIRVGYSVDSDGAARAMMVPISFSTRDSRRCNRKYPQIRIPESYDDLERLQQQIDAAKDELKTYLKANLSPLPAGFERMGRRGLLKLLRESPDGFVRERIDAWAARDLAMRKRFAAASERFAAKREWLFRNWADQIAKAYDRIALETDLNIKSMIEAPTESDTMKRGRRTHHQAGTAIFARCIREAAAKHGCELVDSKAEWTSRICNRCGAVAEKSAGVMLTCANGHAFDRDSNAARNLLFQITHPERWADRLQELPKPRSKKVRQKAAV